MIQKPCYVKLIYSLVLYYFHQYSITINKRCRIRGLIIIVEHGHGLRSQPPPVIDPGVNNLFTGRTPYIYTSFLTRIMIIIIIRRALTG